MSSIPRRQLLVLSYLLIVYAFLSFITYAFFSDTLTELAGAPMPETSVPPWGLGLIAAGIILVTYGLAGLGAIWFTGKVGIPSIYREGAGPQELVVRPLAIGLIAGVILVLGSLLFALTGGQADLPHPPFPLSLIASISAGIGEEILFRGFVMGLWAFLLNLLLRRWQLTRLALWIANALAAVAFAAGHLPTVMFLYHATSLSDLPPSLLVEIFVLNILVALLAGWQAMKNGLVAAMGVHFWADIIWHVIWPLL